VSAVSTYPAHREVDVALRDGSTVRVRPIRSDDEPGLLRFLDRLSGSSRWFRFFSAGTDLESAARWAVDVDYHGRYGVLATTGRDARVVGHATYAAADGEGPAEVAFAIADELQGKGLGTVLLAHLALAAGEIGIERFVAEVLPENESMIDVFRESGFPVTTSRSEGVLRFEFPVELSPAVIERFEWRDETASVAALRPFLAPRSVAVIGAGRERGTISGELFHNLLDRQPAFPVYPVNASAPVVQGVRAYPTIADVPSEVELAVIAVPAPAVVGVARECAAKGVHALIVVSAGFAEVGGDGIARQRELLEVCRATGMRLIGPNCLGVLNTSPGARLNATFAPTFPPAGRVGFLSQSGALGLAVIAQAQALDLGISQFVSIGDKADISGNDLLQWWEQDPDTDVVLLYLESFGNPRRFARVAPRVARAKPIVAVKSGRSAAGARATSSHTGALLAASDVTVGALFHQSGVIRTDTLAELFDVATLLANQPLPRGRRVAIVTNAGGPGIMCADACEASGLEVAPLGKRTQRVLRGLLRAEAAVANPIDMLADASAEEYRRTIAAVGRDADVDAIITIFIQPLVTRGREVEQAVQEAAAELAGRVPVLAVFMSGAERTAGSADGVRVPRYDFPEEAAQALARAARYAEWRARPTGALVTFDDVDADAADAVLAGALEGTGWLDPDAVARLCACYGIPLVASRTVTTPRRARTAATTMGGPVALKAISPTLLHKSDAGGVRLGLQGAAVERAAREMERAVTDAGHQLDGFLVQEMVEGGVELLVGVVHDQLFGPVLACGAGGVLAELQRDIAVRITPLTDLDAREMLRGLGAFPLLEGYRGAPAADVPGVEELVLRVSQMVEAHPEIIELDLNPVLALPERVVVVDARVRVEPAAPPRPWPAVRG